MKLNFLLPFIISCALAQIEPVRGLRDNPPRVWFLKNAVVHTEPGNVIEKGAVLLRGGIIQAVGTGVAVPSDATIIDLDGAHIYAGFIESWLPVKSPDQDDNSGNVRAHWNPKVRAERNPVDYFQPDKSDLRELHELGFTSAHIVPDDGIFRGQSALVQLTANPVAIQNTISNIVAFEYGGWGDPNPPNALLGCIALIRQTLFDTDWYQKAVKILEDHPQGNEPISENFSLASLSEATLVNQPFLFWAEYENYSLRSIDIAAEFDLNLWLKGNGFEYRRLTEIVASNPFIILPIDFPGKPDVAHPYRALQYSTAQLRHWDLAPDNYKKLRDTKASIALTSAELKSKKDFRQNLFRMIERGANKQDILASLTTIPAKYMGVGDQIGKIKKGFLGDLVIVDGDYFDPDSDVRAVWVRGRELQLNPKPAFLITGNWAMILENDSLRFKVSGEKGNYSGEIQVDSTTWEKVNQLVLDQSRLSFTMDLNFLGHPGQHRMAGHISRDKISGQLTDPSGEILNISGIKISDSEMVEDQSDDPELPSSLKTLYPDGAYGLELEPKMPKRIFINDATLWTCSNNGVLKNFDMLIENGKILRIAQEMTVPAGNVHFIEGIGKHITPGLIDCHSHMAALSINEGSQAITAEVRMKDVIDPDDIAMYRALAGGLTTINLLHGSANPIGGQNAVLKLRWGENARDLLFKNAPQGIKFALGENVKRSNWNDPTNRYPKSRMGVEQIILDGFRSANDYKRRWAKYHRDSQNRRTKIPPRIDLELEALIEIMEGDRLLHCHSYRQDEILMLTRIAEQFGFTIATFQHVLEGYKVAERLKEHGAGASTFSDWWAYKFEVIDAIPFNGTLMENVGVNVSFNSDSDELARRMNTEGSKGIKYGGLSEEDALNLVTINPARQLKIDEWVGSLEPGKDADFVVWNGHPLSTYTSCEETWIEGRQYFSKENDIHLRIRDENIRNELVQKILEDSKSTSENSEPDEEEKESYSCTHHQENIR